MKPRKAYTQLQKVSSAKIARIVKVTQQHSRVTNDKRLYCTIELSKGGLIDNVPFYGGGADIETGFAHGTFIPPRERQLVLVLFVDSNIEEPVACVPLPQPVSEEDTETFYDLVESVQDVGVYHFSGSRFILREDGTFSWLRIFDPTEPENHGITLEIAEDMSTKTFKDINNEQQVIWDEEKTEFTDKFGNTILIQEDLIQITTSNGHNIEMGESILMTDKDGNTLELTGSVVKINGDAEPTVLGDTLASQMETFLQTITNWATGMSTWHSSVLAAASAGTIPDPSGATFATFCAALVASASPAITADTTAASEATSSKANVPLIKSSKSELG